MKQRATVINFSDLIRGLLSARKGADCLRSKGCRSPGPIVEQQGICRRINSRPESQTRRSFWDSWRANRSHGNFPTASIAVRTAVRNATAVIAAVGHAPLAAAAKAPLAVLAALLLYPAETGAVC